MFLYEKINVILKELKECIFHKEFSVDHFRYAECGYMTDAKSVSDKSLSWQDFEKGMRFGGVDKHFWVNFSLKTPPKKDNFECVLAVHTGNAADWDAVNPQGLVYLNGKIEQGLDTNHTEVLLEYDREYDISIYFYTGMKGGLFDLDISLSSIDKRVEKLYYDLFVPLEATKYIEKNEKDYLDTINTLNKAVSMLDLRILKSAEFYDSVKAATKYLDENFYNALCGKSDIVVNCIGHTHIDVAWLWTLEQTREKAQRSFSTVIKLMEQYPEYKFMSSQPQLYAFVKENAPELYGKIKQAVKDGRWEVEGAMWLEADCNLTSGESLVRQIIFGKRFMKEEFGVDSRILWLPDVFGYSAAMPQILKKSGVDKFVTSKISWNETNKMPYDAFMWQGIDGTELFTYFLTTRAKKPFGENDSDDRHTSYCGKIQPAQVIGTWKRFQQKAYSDETLIAFGYGDGGGGPTKDMLEQQRRLAYGLPGYPKTQISFAGEFLERVEKKFLENSAKLKKMPKWVGELYLELHRGTYTSIAKNKKNNRKSELAYQRIEALSVIDMLNGGSYPQEAINENWRKILLNQFHDIIPGSSIFEVYEDSDKQYAEILETAKSIQKEKIDGIVKSIKTDGGLFVYNPNGFAANGTVSVDGKTVYIGSIPPFGYKVVKDYKADNNITFFENGMENDFFKVTLRNGKIVSVYDKRNGFEAIEQGKYANEIQIFEDIPKFYDAWEITDYYAEKMWTADELVLEERISDGTRAGIRQVRKYLNSTIEQKIWLYSDIDRIDFETVIDWKEAHMLVKAAFPVNVNAVEATYDIQFGSVKRPTHKNTSWDEAKFEVCAHKWADISDNGYGVSILNDCKYGYSADGNTLKLTLLKCATDPNKNADKEVHKFTYSLYPHKGTVYEADTIKQAYMLNQPLVAEKIGAQNGAGEETFSLFGCDKDNVIMETVKKAENESGVILRMYESKNMKTKANIALGKEFKKAFLCDLMENEIKEIPLCGNLLPIEISGFEILTLKLK